MEINKLRVIATEMRELRQQLELNIIKLKNLEDQYDRYQEIQSDTILEMESLDAPPSEADLLIDDYVKSKMEIINWLSGGSIKPVRHLLQIDCWTGGDGVHKCDEDGHVITGQWKDEPRNSDYPVRIQIIDEACSRGEIVALLEKAVQWLKEDWNALSTLRFENEISTVLRRRNSN